MEGQEGLLEFIQEFRSAFPDLKEMCSLVPEIKSALTAIPEIQAKIAQLSNIVDCSNPRQTNGQLTHDSQEITSLLVNEEASAAAADKPINETDPIGKVKKLNVAERKRQKRNQKKKASIQSVIASSVIEESQETTASQEPL